VKSTSNPVAAALSVVARCAYADTPDAVLLRRFVDARDEPAFSELVRRYGGLVWRTARAAARDRASAEDAFQATFLALARHASAIRNPAALAGWLHRTAHRAAVRSRKSGARELPTSFEPAAPQPDPLDQLSARELLAAIDEEVQALPETYRAVVLLCGVEGLSQEEAAKRLGWSAGSLKGRLERGRERLRERLDARGLTVPATLAGLITPGNASAAPTKLIGSTLSAVQGGVVSPAVARLIAEVSRMNLSFWLKGATTVAFVAGGLTLAAGYWPVGSPISTSGPPTRAEPVLKASPPEKLVLWSSTVYQDNPILPAAPTLPLAFPADGAFTTDGKWVVTIGNAWRPGDVGRKGDIRIWDPRTGEAVLSYPMTADNYANRTLAVSPDGKHIAAGGIVLAPGGDNVLVEVRDCKGNAPIHRLTGLEERPVGLSFSPNGEVLAGADAQGNLLTWEVATGKRQLTIKAKPTIQAIAFHPSSSVLAAADVANGVRFYDMGTGAERGGIAPRWGEEACAVAFSRDGQTVAVGLASVPLHNGRPIHDLPLIISWDVTITERGDVEIANRRHSASRLIHLGIHQVAFSPDGRLIATAVIDGTVQIYDAATARLLAIGKEHTEPVGAIAFSPDGKRLLTIGPDAVKIWSVAELLKRKPKE
jgi:RNA polymerase sigma factor (sigma-70 family)